MNQAVRQWHGPRIVPKRFTHPSIRGVVKNQKITDTLILHFVEAVELIDQPGVHAGGSWPWHEIDEIGDGGLDEVDAGGFQRLEEAARQTDRHAIAGPRP